MNTGADICQWLFEEFSSRLAWFLKRWPGSGRGSRSSRFQRRRRPMPHCAGISRSPESGRRLDRRRGSFLDGAGGCVLRAAGIEEMDAASLKSTYLETVSQALSGIAGAMGGRLGHEVTCSGGEESLLSPSVPVEAQWAMLRVHLGAEIANVAVGLSRRWSWRWWLHPAGRRGQGKIAEVAARRRWAGLPTRQFQDVRTAAGCRTAGERFFGERRFL